MLTILLADDEQNLRTLVHATLDDSVYDTVEATDGIEALEAARTLKPALIILDWMMPGRTGLEVTQLLKSDPATSEIPIILLTAKSQPQDRAAAVGAGADAYLSKPFSPLELLENVDRLLAATGGSR